MAYGVQPCHCKFSLRKITYGVSTLEALCANLFD
jgi:hypothetical protein